MDKEEQQIPEKEISDNNSEIKTEAENKVDTDTDPKEERNEQESSPEEKIKELEDKLARTFAEMENQRRRFEKEKEDAFEYGGTSFAKEALNLIDNLFSIIILNKPIAALLRAKGSFELVGFSFIRKNPTKLSILSTMEIE